MANEAMMAQILRGSDYAGPEGGYSPDAAQLGLGAYGQPRPQGPGVIPQDALAQAMAKPPPAAGQLPPAAAAPQPGPIQAPAPTAPTAPRQPAGGAGGGMGNSNRTMLY